MTPQEAQFAAALCATRAGLIVDAGKTYLLESRLAPVARRENFTSLTDFLQAVRDRGEERLVRALVEALSPCVGEFFRDPAVFPSMTREVSARAAKGQGPVRIWVAAAGAGQEAYSLAMALQEQAGDAAVEILASDLSERRLEKGRSGLFTQFEVQRGLSAQRLVRHFEKTDDLFQINADLRAMISWQAVDLASPAPPPGRFDMILCRYALGAMTHEGQAAAVRTLDQALAPGGWLFVGAEEQAAGLLSTPSRPGFYYKAGGGLSAAAA